MQRKLVDEIKEHLLKTKSEIINGNILSSSEDLHISSDDLPDEADLATSVINQQVTFGLRQREIRKLREIEEALDRIDKGDYGLCEDCDEPISPQRLKRQPWAKLCIFHAEEREREQRSFI